MAIKVSRALRRAIGKDPGGILVLVQTDSDPQAAGDALRRAGGEIAALDGGWQSAPNLNPGDTNSPKYVGPVATTSIGHLLQVDGGYTPEELLATIPDIITRHLVEAGVIDAVLTEPPSEGPLGGLLTGATLHTLPRAVVLDLYPPAEPNRAGMPRARATVPPGWLDEAAGWLRAGVREEGDEVWIMSIAQYPVAHEATRDAVDQVWRSGNGEVVAGDVTTRIRVARSNSMGFQWLSLGGGGPAATDDELVATFEELRVLARRLAPEVAYAYVSLQLTFGGMHGYCSRPGRASWQSVERMPEEIVLDAFPAQILGPAHLARIGAGGVDLERERGVQLHPLGANRVELSIGEAPSWLPDRPERAALEELGHRVLAPCLLEEERAIEVYQAKLREETP